MIHVLVKCSRCDGDESKESTCWECGSEPDIDGEVSHKGWKSVPWHCTEDYLAVHPKDRAVWVAEWAEPCLKGVFTLEETAGGRWSISCCGNIFEGRTAAEAIANYNDWVIEELENE